MAPATPRPPGAEWEDGYPRERLLPVENRAVVTDPRKGAVANRWMPILERHGLPFTPLQEVEWVTYPFRSPLLKLPALFPEGIQVPKLFIDRNVLHLPTMKDRWPHVYVGC